MLLSMMACSALYGPPPWRIVTSGSHLPYSDKAWAQAQQIKRTYVVWGNDPVATSAAIEWLHTYGHRVIESDRVQQVLDAQHFSLTYTSTIEQIVLIGASTEADRVLLVDASDVIESVNEIGSEKSHSFFVHRLQVTVRAVDVSSQEVRWNGVATTNIGLPHPLDPQWTVRLTRAAIGQATCFTERGFVWIDQFANGVDAPWGCIKKG